MKNISLFIVLISLSTIMCAQKQLKIKGNKNVTTVAKVFDTNFTTIEIDNALEVILQQGKENRVQLTTDENLHDIIQFSVRDSILKIYTTQNIVSSKKLVLELTVKEVKHLLVKNDATVKSKGKLRTKDILYLTAYNASTFDLEIHAPDVMVVLQRKASGKLHAQTTNTTLILNDKTDLDADIQARKTRVTLTASAALKLTGNTDFAALNIKDAATINAKKMKVASMDLYTSNSSEVSIHVTKNLELYAKGKSMLYVYGNPKIDVKELTDKSKIIKK